MIKPGSRPRGEGKTIQPGLARGKCTPSAAYGGVSPQESMSLDSQVAPAPLRIQFAGVTPVPLPPPRAVGLCQAPSSGRSCPIGLRIGPNLKSQISFLKSQTLNLKPQTSKTSPPFWHCVPPFHPQAVAQQPAGYFFLISYAEHSRAKTSPLRVEVPRSGDRGAFPTGAAWSACFLSRHRRGCMVLSKEVGRFI